MRILNVHERRIAAAPDAVGDIVGTLGSSGDRLWPGSPAGAWPPMRLDRPLAVGARGGHSRVRYHVASYVPGRSVRFEFEDDGTTRGLRGGHRFEVEPSGAETILRHVIEADAMSPAALVRWILLLRPLHDALMEDALDRAEMALTGRVARPSRWSAWVRFLSAVLGRKAQRAARGRWSTPR